MNKSDLIDAIASKTGMTKQDSKQALEGIVYNISKAIKKGKRVSLMGFGSFTTIKRSARRGRNPKTGEEMMISARKSVKFKPSLALSDALN